MKKKIFTIILSLGIVAMATFSSFAETESYYKVYKGADGYYHGYDVTYEAPDEDGTGTLITVLVIAGVLFIITKIAK